MREVNCCRQKFSNEPLLRVRQIPTCQDRLPEALLNNSKADFESHSANTPRLLISVNESRFDRRVLGQADVAGFSLFGWNRMSWSHSALLRYHGDSANSAGLPLARPASGFEGRR
jgi:hypothetical protein